jgi:uncharacterized protein (DUF305 family)
MTTPDSEPTAEQDLTEDQRGPRRFRWFSPAVGVVVLAVVAGMIGAAVATPDDPGDTSAEAGFARDMAVHHAQAVEMATVVRDNTGDDEIRTVALDILLTQQNQIGRMQAWLIHWNLPLIGERPPMAWMNGSPGHGQSHAGAAQPAGTMPGMATGAELQRLRVARGEDAEILFLTLMIRHHRGGITMANAVLQHTGNREVGDLARSMVNAQQAEITTMQQSLKARGAPPA